MPLNEEWTIGAKAMRRANQPATSPRERQICRRIRDFGMEQLENWYRKRENRRTRVETIRDLNELRMWHLELALRKNGLWDDDKDGYYLDGKVLSLSEPYAKVEEIFNFEDNSINGFSNKDISTLLDIPYKKVDNYLESIKARLKKIKKDSVE